MTTTTFDLPRVMPADAARVRAVEQSGERLATLGLRISRAVGRVTRDLFEGRARHDLMAAASAQAAERPELSAALRRARASWME